MRLSDERIEQILNQHRFEGIPRMFAVFAINQAIIEQIELIVQEADALSDTDMFLSEFAAHLRALK